VKYYAKYKAMENIVVDLNSVSKTMGNYANRLNRVNSSLGFDKSLSNIRNNISSRANAVNRIINASNHLKTGISNIRLEYMNGEQNAYNKLNGDKPFFIGGPGGFIKLAVNKIKSLFEKWKISWSPILQSNINVGSAVAISSWSKISWGFLTPFVNFIKDAFKRPGKWKPIDPNPFPNRKTYTLAEENKADHRMRDETLNIRLDYENEWRKARTEVEKREILNSYMADVQNILGTRARPNINFASLGSTSGSFNPHSRQISINSDMLNKPEGINLLKTVAHEVRHAYQTEAAMDSINHPVSDETRAIWRDNKRNYIRPSFSNCDEYYNQPIEADAFWFSGVRNSK